MTGFPHEVLLRITCNEDGENALHRAPAWCKERGWRIYTVPARQWIFPREVPSSVCPVDFYIENRDDGNTAAYCFANPRNALLFKLTWVGA